jgi:hypothetical protein
VRTHLLCGDEFITPYTPEQNGIVERFFRSLKEQCVWQHNFAGFAEARSEVTRWIDWYNESRPHQALGYRSPRQFRRHSWCGCIRDRMNMDTVDRLLPNGFHDGVLRRLVVDYELATLCLDVEFWIGDMECEASREVYRLGRVTISGLGVLVIDSPSNGHGPFTGALIIDGGPGQPSTSMIPLPPVPSGAFLYWLFVDEWNSFIRFSGREAALEWMGEAVAR